MRDILIFGASGMGNLAYEYMIKNDYYNIVGFVDNDIKKQGQQKFEKPIISPLQIKDYNGSYIVIASLYEKEISEQLESMGIKEYFIFYFDGIKNENFISKNLFITDNFNDYINQDYNVRYYKKEDLNNREYDRDFFDNIIIDMNMREDKIFYHLDKINIPSSCERLFYINLSENLGKIKKKFYNISLLGSKDFFPETQIIKLQCSTINTTINKNLEAVICENKIRNYYFTNRIELVGAEKKYIDSVVDYKKAEYLKELSEKVPVSNGSRYYEKFNIIVGIICDEFLFNLYKDCCNLVYITPQNYPEYTDKIKVLIVVTTFCGLNNEWNLSDEKKFSVTKDIIQKYKRNDIKIVFYSKEDPVHFDEFLPYAKLADYIFTTDMDCIPKYKDGCKNEKVFQLSFGINPLYHNPIGIGNYNYPGIVFSGTWYYNTHAERRLDFRLILGGIQESGEELTLIDRRLDIEKNGFISFPPEFSQYVLPKVQHKELQSIHKLFDWAININTVKDSPTMCANRVFELQAQGNVLLSNYSKAVANIFPNIFIINEKNDIKKLLDKYNNKTMLLELKRTGIRNVMSNHTSYDRMRYLMNCIGIQLEKQEKKILVIAEKITSDIEKVFNSQTYRLKYLVQKDELNIKYLSEYSFFTYFNSKVNYDKFYLEDMVNAFKYTDVDFVTTGLAEEVKKNNYVSYFENNYQTLFSVDKMLGSNNLKDLQQLYFGNGYLL